MNKRKINILFLYNDFYTLLLNNNFRIVNYYLCPLKVKNSERAYNTHHYQIKVVAQSLPTI